jgi:SSS family solute:Na+ symporter
MNLLDWIVVAAYMAGMVVLAVYAGRKQETARDYYLGGNRMSHWTIGLSTMATQCSTNSLLGAPAFVIAMGGLVWLQYELAVPLAMIGVTFQRPVPFFVPFLFVFFP